MAQATMAPGSTIHLPTGQSVKVGVNTPQISTGSLRMTPKWIPVVQPPKTSKK